MTEGQKLSGNQVLIDGNELVQGYAGHMHYTREGQRNYPAMLLARKRRFGEGWEIASREEEKEARARITSFIEGGAKDAMSPYGMTWGKVLNTPKIMKTLVEQAAHFDREPEDIGKVRVQELLDMVQESRPYQDITRQLKRDLTRREMLELASFLDLERDGRVVIEDDYGDLFNEFRRGLFNQDTASRALSAPRMRANTLGPLHQRQVQPSTGSN